MKVNKKALYILTVFLLLLGMGGTAALSNGGVKPDVPDCG